MRKLEYDYDSGSDNTGKVKEVTQVVEAMNHLHERANALLQVVGDLKDRLQPVLPAMVTNVVNKSDLPKAKTELVPLAADLRLIKGHMNTAVGAIRDIINECQL